MKTSHKQFNLYEFIFKGDKSGCICLPSYKRPLLSREPNFLFDKGIPHMPCTWLNLLCHHVNKGDNYSKLVFSLIEKILICYSCLPYEHDFAIMLIGETTIVN